MFDGKAFGAEIVGIVKEYVAKEVAPLHARIAELEARAPATGRDGKDGLDGAPGVGVAKAGVSDAGVLILTLSDGSEIEAGPVKGAAGQDGKAGEPGEPGEPGQNGKDADPEEVAKLVTFHVEKAVSALPKAKDGRDGADGKDGEPGRDGKDGVGLAGAWIGRQGDLVVTLSNGEAKSLGPVVGKDGEAGKGGADGKDGIDGRNGEDGLGFEDMDERLEDDGRTIVRTYRRGEVVKKFRFTVPAVLDRGVYKAGQAYQPGDGVTWGGSFWIAQKATDTKPDGGDGTWRLAVKKGRDGRDGELKPAAGPAKVKVG